MPSITSWTRLEPRAREGDVRVGLQARIHDPLWLLARQWQFGEFKGEDAGSPVAARVEADSFGLTRYLPRPLPPRGPAAGQPIDTRVAPLEVIVEREPVVRAGGVNLRVAADAGRHFRRLLAAAGLAAHAPAYLARYPFVRPAPDQAAAVDERSTGPGSTPACARDRSPIRACRVCPRTRRSRARTGTRRSPSRSSGWRGTRPSSASRRTPRRRGCPSAWSTSSPSRPPRRRARSC